MKPLQQILSEADQQKVGPAEDPEAGPPASRRWGPAQQGPQRGRQENGQGRGEGEADSGWRSLLEGREGQGRGVPGIAALELEHPHRVVPGRLKRRHGMGVDVVQRP